MLLLFSLQTSAQAQQAPLSETEPVIAQDVFEEEPDQADTDGLAEGGANLRNRPAKLDEPVASEAWTRAGFTGFIDIDQRLAEPEADMLEQGLRLLTSDDFPPFNYRDEEGAPIGYHVELARALCDQLSIACTLKVVPFAQIPALLSSGEADAALSGVSRHPDLEGQIAFSHAFLHRPARFLRLKTEALSTDMRSLEGAPVGLLGGSAHEAYLKAYFPHLNRVPVTDFAAAERLLRDSKIVAIFGDAFQLLPLVMDSKSPFSFAGKPYYDSHFFGDGMAIAYPFGKADLKNLLNHGLLRLAQTGRLAELYARHFALDIYAVYD